jgi:UMF1 family MFS transporter
VPKAHVSGESGSLLRRLNLERRDIRAWVTYDWANSAFMTSVFAAVFPIYFATVAAHELPPGVATRRFALATAATLAVLALAAPLLGAVADRAGSRKRFLGGFLLLGSGATASLAMVGPGDWVLGIVLFALANVGAYGSLVFYDSLLPHLAERAELDRVSAAGYAAGYLGGGLLLAVHLLWLRYPEAFGLRDAEFAARLAFVTVAMWWLAFSLPLFRRVAEPAGGTPRGRPGLSAGLRGLIEPARELGRHRDALLFLIAFLIYSDGIGTIIRLAAVYGSELGIPGDALVAAILTVQFVAFPCTLLFGRLAARVGTKRALFAGLAVYALICVLGFAMRTPAHFFGLAILVGMVQGGTQAISRSLFAALIPRAQSAEFFAFFAVTERFAGLVGPSLFALVGSATGSNRYAILGLVALFAVGAAVLVPVDIERGKRAASSQAPESVRSRGA